MVQLHCGNAVDILKTFPASYVDCTVTSPPYYQLRRYNHPDEIGNEVRCSEYIAKLGDVFREVYRITKPTGVCFINIGDTYLGQQQLGVPFKLLDEVLRHGWKFRQMLIWQKVSPMPSSVKNRFTDSHEYILFLVKKSNYYFDMSLIQEPATYAGKSRGGSKRRYEQNNAQMDNKIYDTRNPRTVFTIRQEYTQPEGSSVKHYARFPKELITPFITAGCPADGVVLDPFCGSGTTLEVAKNQGKRSIGIDIIKEYIEDVYARW